MSATRTRETLRGSRPPLPPTRSAPPGPVTFSVPRWIACVNVTVTVRIDVLAVEPLAGEVDLTSVCAAAGAASASAAAAPRPG